MTLYIDASSAGHLILPDTCSAARPRQQQNLLTVPSALAGSKAAAAPAACDAMETQEYGDQFTFNETEASPAVKPQVHLSSAFRSRCEAC